MFRREYSRVSLGYPGKKRIYLTRQKKNNIREKLDTFGHIN